jgi:hypothetical protein
MRLPRMTTQRWWALLLILSVLLWGGREVGPDLARRWDGCRRQAAWHAKRAGHYRAGAPGSSGRRRADHLRKAAEYRRALWNPWKFYVLGDKVPPVDNP